jgi:hypothetical protein
MRDDDHPPRGATPAGARGAPRGYARTRESGSLPKRLRPLERLCREQQAAARHLYRLRGPAFADACEWMRRFQSSCDRLRLRIAQHAIDGDEDAALRDALRREWQRARKAAAKARAILASAPDR